jgi:hypothetical protein
MSINSNHEVGEFVHAGNRVMNEFNNTVYSVHQSKTAITDGYLKGDDDCCRRMANWQGCFECTTSFFSKKWYGIVAFATIGKEFAAAIGISCIGAGPNTFC